mmetsp:Transcript_25904/g.63761  ORF Transcript_25904/g.63761 Transcript_25904/m.63761 type:complete len:254 (+) Transcript_25904:82-843(+)
MDMPGSPAEALDMLTRIKYAVPMTRWTCYWAVMFIVFRMVVFRKYTADFSNRVVSIVHAFVAIYYSYVTFSSWGDMFDGIGGPNTEPQALCMAVSLSYFVYDLIYCAIVGEIESVFHHFFTIGGLASGVLNGKSGAELVACLFLMEVSNPSLHLRTLLLEMGLKSSTIFSLNNLIFALVFLVCRLLIGPPLVYKTIACPDNEYIVKLGGFGIMAVSIMWGWKIIMMFVKELKKLLGIGGGGGGKLDKKTKKTQ